MKPLRFGIVGTGRIAHHFAEAIQHVPQAELVAVASRHRETAERFGDEFHLPLRFDNYEAMAASSDVEAAYIGVPHAGHSECACLMMNGGKHVLCEKPMAVTAAEAQRMMACAEKNGVFLMEAMWSRFLPGTETILQWVREGKLGDIGGVEAKFCYALAPSQMGHHVMKRENGGGSLLDVGVYALHFTEWILGQDVVSMDAEASLYEGVDAHTSLLLRFQNGAIADLSSAVLLEKPNDGYVYGSRGYLHFPRFYAPERIEFVGNDGCRQTLSVPFEGNGFEGEIAHVCDCVAKGLHQSPIHSWDKTRYVLRQMDAIRRKIGVTYPQDML